MIVAGPLVLAGIEVLGSLPVSNLFEGRLVIVSGVVYHYSGGDFQALGDADPFPDQTGNAGKFLTTDGSVTSWGIPAGAGDAQTSGTLAQFAATTSAELAGVISDETGSGSLVFSNSPTLVTPVLGAATATSINKLSITAPATGSTLAIADGKTLTASNTLTLAGTDGSSVAFGAGGTVAYTSNKLSDFAATTSAELLGIITDETGTGSLVFSDSPVLVTPTLGVATATSINKVTITAPASGSTLTIANGKTLTVSNSLNFSATDGAAADFVTGGTVAYTSNKLSAFAATTSAELLGVISDETGSGSLVFGTGPTLDGPTIDNSAIFLHETTPATPSAGRVKLYPKSDNNFYVLDSSGIETQIGSGGGGSGSGGVNLISYPSTATNWSKTGTVFATPATTTTSGDLPLSGATNTAIKFVATGSGTEATNYNSFSVTTPAAMNGKVQIDFFLRPGSGFAANEWTVSVYQGSTRQSLSADSSSVCYIPNTSGRFTVSFDATASTAYTLRFARISGSGSATLNVCNVFFGWPFVSQTAAVSDWQTYTMTITGTGGNPSKASSPVTDLARYRRVGSFMEIEYDYLHTASAGSAAGTGTYLFALPSGYTIDTTKQPVSAGTANYQIGNGYIYDGTTEYTATTSAWNTTNFAVYVWTSISATAVVGATRAALNSAAVRYSLRASIPIAEWAGNGTVNLGAGAQVQYLYNSATGTSTDSSSFAYGPSGVLVPGSALAADITRRVRSQYPISATTDIVLKLSVDQVNWVPVGEFTGGVCSYISGTATSYGIGWARVSGSTTDIDVTIARYRRPAGTWDAAGADWAGAVYWRLEVRNPSSSVGFGLAGTDGSAGLYKAGQAPGLTTGAAIPAGYVGEVLSQSRVRASSVSLTSPTVQNVTANKITLTPGVWLISGTVGFIAGATTSVTEYVAGISKTAATIPASSTYGVPTSGESTMVLDLPSTVNGGGDFLININPFIYSVSSATDIYLIGRAVFTTSTMTMYGSFQAVRIA